MNSIKRFAVSGVVVAALAFPLAAGAQTTNNCGWNGWLNNNLSGCGTGTLLVYMQGGALAVSVLGQNPAPHTFTGSTGGTLVTLGSGQYSVLVNNSNNYSAQYSAGCNGTIYQNQTNTCVITVASGQYPAYPVPYPYPYSLQPLTCSPSYQTVALGRVATFAATGGSGTYTWSTPTNTYQGSGAVLNTSFNSTGTHIVTVTSGSATAACSVAVVGADYYPPTYLPAQTTPVAAVTYVVPTLPNTGFEPVDGAMISFALVLLLGAGAASYPYVKRAVAVVLG